MKSIRIRFATFDALATVGAGLLKEAHSICVWLAPSARPRGQKVDI
jgi:hypothetical protein